jgi:hypothetical protein
MRLNRNKMLKWNYMRQLHTQTIEKSQIIWLCSKTVKNDWSGQKNIEQNGILMEHFAKWKGINHKQSTRWQHLSRLKASAFFFLQKKFSCYKTQQLILGTGIAIWWLTEAHSSNRSKFHRNGLGPVSSFNHA